MTSPSRPRRSRYRPPDDVVAAAVAAGVDPASLRMGAAAAALAGYDGPTAAKSLAAARRRGHIEGFAAADGSAVWFPLATLEEWRSRRRPTAPAPPSEEQRWDTPAPVERIEHELELELERVRGEAAVLRVENEQLRAELTRAQRVASALAATLADQFEPGG